MPEQSDHQAVQSLIDEFFEAFTSGPGLGQRLDDLAGLFLPEAVIVRTCGDIAAYDVEAFVAPRRALLTGGEIEEFREWAVEGRLDLFGDIASWFGSYAKSWTRAGRAETGAGQKAIHLVRTAVGWRISALSWDDVR